MAMHDEARLLDGSGTHEDVVFDRAVRPRTLEEYVGQPSVKRQMRIFMTAARNRGEALDHTLIFGPPGLGKTTLAYIVANELEVNLRTTSGPVLERPGDLAAILTNLESRDVLFVDEIHRLSPVVEEVLYPALEDFRLDIMIGEGPGARSIKLELPPFTLVGATTRAGLLTSPLRDRFGIVQRLEFYGIDELMRIVRRTAGIFDLPVDDAGAREVAARSRGTPRIANRLLRRVRGLRRSGMRRQRDPAGGAGGDGPARSRSARIRQHGPQASSDRHREIRRRPRGHRQSRGRRGRGTGHAGRRGGALSDPGRVPAAYRARTHGHAQRLPALRAQGSQRE